MARTEATAVADMDTDMETAATMNTEKDATTDMGTDAIMNTAEAVITGMKAATDAAATDISKYRQGPERAISAD